MNNSVQPVGDSVTFTDVTKSYGGKEVLHSFNVEVNAGELVSLLGPSGCGKSTVLRCLSGFETITHGDICIGGRSIIATPPQRRGIGMVFQQYSLFPNMNVLDNVAFGLKVRRVSREERISEARKTLELVGLTEFAEQYPSRLSGGQQQRVALARAIVVNPKVLLLDEPLSALDAKIRVQLRNEIRALQQRLGITAIFVTHDQEEALAISDRIAVMHDGNIEQIGTPKELYVTPATPFVADFVGQSNKVETTVGLDGTVNVCGFALPLSSPQPDKTLVMVYIRPENVSFEPDAQGPFEVTGTNYLGSIQRTTAQGGSISLTSQHAPSMHYRVHDRVRVVVRQEAVVAKPIEIRWVEPMRAATAGKGKQRE